MSVAISNFKAAGVDFVIIAANVILAGPFAQSADRAASTASTRLSDFNNQINDQVASYYPDSFEGTIALQHAPVQRVPGRQPSAAGRPALHSTAC